jgi:hypothetical protein
MQHNQFRRRESCLNCRFLNIFVPNTLQFIFPMLCSFIFRRDMHDNYMAREGVSQTQGFLAHLAPTLQR